MKKFNLPYLKIVSFILIALISVYCLTHGIKNACDFEIYKQPEASTKIYSVWHIETFEGGSKARIEYLKQIARKLERENTGVLFAIKQIEPGSLDLLLKESKPDICSFGFGVGKSLLNLLQPLDSTHSVRDELIESGSFNNTLYAIPYIVSGYAIFDKGTKNSNFVCGENNYIHPQKIYKNLNLEPTKQQSQYQAYKQFVNEKNAKFLGTARDVFRVTNLINIGRLNAEILPVESYTDLIQYISVLTPDEMTKKFVSACVNIENQSTLKDYHLFSSTYNKLYNSGIYNDMENAILKAKIPCVFND